MLFRSEPAVDPYFGNRKVYTALVNMPNMSSRNGSWVLRFAEPQGREGNGEMSTPAVLKKVDPSYEASAQRDRVQGLSRWRRLWERMGRSRKCGLSAGSTRDLT